MKELTKTRRLSIASILFLLILMIGFITFRSPEYKYNISANEMLENIVNETDVVSPDVLNNHDAILVDLRNNYDYNRGTLDNAINIPVSDILEKDVMIMFDEWKSQSKNVVLFAENQRSANAPWMLLKQLGYDNIKILAGGYCYISNQQSDKTKNAANNSHKPEQPAMDFAKFIEDASGGEISVSKNDPVKILPVKRKKKSVTEGGC